MWKGSSYHPSLVISFNYANATDQISKTNLCCFFHRKNLCLAAHQTIHLIHHIVTLHKIKAFLEFFGLFSSFSRVIWWLSLNVLNFYHYRISSNKRPQHLLDSWISMLDSNFLRCSTYWRKRHLKMRDNCFKLNRVIHMTFNCFFPNNTVKLPI